MVNKVPVRAIRLILGFWRHLRIVAGGDRNRCSRFSRPDRGGHVGGRGKAGRCDRDSDLVAADDDAGHRALRLQIEHVDHIAFGAPFHRLAANGEIEAGGFVNQGDIVVALHQIRLGEIGDP